MKFLAIDIECASHYVRGSMCSFGYIVFETDISSVKEISRGDLIINPGCRITDKHCKLVYEHSVYRAAPSFPDCFSEINDLLTSCDFVAGHAILNDIKFLEEAYKRYGKKIPSFKYICTQLIYKEFSGGINAVSVEDISLLLNLDGLTLHKSVDDAYVSMRLLCHMLENNTLPDLLKSLYLIYGEYSHGTHIKQYDARHNKEALFWNHYKNIPKNAFPLARKEKKAAIKYYFEPRIIRQDIDSARDALTAVINSGGIYIPRKDYSSINYYVTAEAGSLPEAEKNKIAKANQNGASVRLITFGELWEKFRPEQQVYNSDLSIIRRYSAANKN